MTIYRAIGVTGDVTECDTCGRTGLKRTVAIENRDSGEVQYLGTSCAADRLMWSKSWVLDYHKSGPKSYDCSGCGAARFPNKDCPDCDYDSIEWAFDAAVKVLEA